MKLDNIRKPRSLLPSLEEITPSKIPWITVSLSALLVLVYAFQVQQIPQACNGAPFLAYCSALEIIERNPIAWFFTPLFHGHHLKHLAPNILLLLTFGHSIESRYDWREYLPLLAATGFVSIWAQTLLNFYQGESQFVAIGISGAVFGLAAFYIVDEWEGTSQLQQRLLQLVDPTWTDVVHAIAWAAVFVAFLIHFQIVDSFGSATASHIIGMFIGAGSAILMNQERGILSQLSNGISDIQIRR